MTPEDRETLEELIAYATARAEWHPSLMGPTDPGWDEDDLAECVEAAARWALRALALRAALVERTCGTCVEIAHVVHYYTGEDVDELLDRYRLEQADNERYRVERAPKEGA